MRLYQLFILVGLLFQAACSEGEKQQPEARSDVALAAESKEAAHEDRPLYWAVSQTYYPPFVFRNKRGFLIGLDVDLLNAIAEKENIQITFMPSESDNVLRKLDENNADIVLGGINITPKRLQQYAFTQPYLSAPNAFLSEHPTRGTQTDLMQQLNGKTVAVIDEAYQNVAIQSGVEPKSYDNLRQGISAMKKKSVAAVYDNVRVLELYAEQESNVFLLKDTAHSSRFGFALRKDNPVLKRKLNSGLAAIRKDGTYQKIVEKWSTETVKEQI